MPNGKAASSGWPGTGVQAGLRGTHESALKRRPPAGDRLATQVMTSLPVHSALTAKGCQPATSGRAGTVVHVLVAGSKAAPAPGWMTTICVPVQTAKAEFRGDSGDAGVGVQARVAGSYAAASPAAGCLWLSSTPSQTRSSVPVQTDACPNRPRCTPDHCERGHGARDSRRRSGRDSYQP